MPPLVPLPELLADARSGGYAVGYFEAWDIASLEAVVEAAEAERAPVVLGFGCMLVDQPWLDAGGIETLGAVGRTIAERARVPAALLLNEAHAVDQAIRGLDAGFTAAMLHTSGGLDSVGDVRALVEVAHARGAAVEGELGTLPDAGVPATGRLTDPDDAAAFVRETGVDCLAVSVGNVHLLQDGTAAIDLDRLAAIHERVGAPLVLHGGTGLPPEAMPDLIARGVAKINVGTTLKQAFLDGLADAVTARSPELGPHDLLGSHGRADLAEAGKRRMVPVVRELIRLYGGAGRA